jgi:hypothetical protein
VLVFVVRWLGGSFAKLGLCVDLCCFANVPPNAMNLLYFQWSAELPNSLHLYFLTNLL